MSLKSRNKIFGLLGNPLKHSLSPCMHNAALRALKIKARYRLFDLSFEQLPVFFLKIKENNIAGFNVTIPYKEKVLPYLNSISSGARQIGAVNTVTADGSRRLKGFNTDYLGFMRHLKILKVKPDKAALIGAGGAARAVCFALGKLSARQVQVYDIDVYRAISLVNQFKDTFKNCRFSAVARIEDLNIKNRDLLVNASPVGMKDSDPCLIREDMLHPDLFVYDLIYNPAQTKLLALAKKAQIGHANGLGMLLYQGAIAFRHFTGKPAPIKIMREALIKKARGI